MTEELDRWGWGAIKVRGWQPDEICDSCKTLKKSEGMHEFADGTIRCTRCAMQAYAWNAKAEIDRLTEELERRDPCAHPYADACPRAEEAEAECEMLRDQLAELRAELREAS